MALVRWNDRPTSFFGRRYPSSFFSLQDELNRMFEESFPETVGSLSPVMNREGMMMVPTDVKETDKGYRVEIDMPGMRENDIDISLENNVLTVKGERMSEHKEDKEGLIRNERSYGSFYRQIPFSAPVDEERVNATMKSGVLTIDLEKKPEAQTQRRRINVRSS